MIGLMVAALLIAAPSAAVTAPANVPPGVPSLDSAELAEWIAKDANILVFDLRSLADYQDGHVPFAVSLPLDAATRAKAETKLEQMLKGAPRRVVLYGADPMTLGELAEKAAHASAGGVAVYPAGVEGWAGFEGGYLELEWPGFFRALTLESPVVLDVREAEEYAAGHVPGARRFDPAKVSAKTLAEKPWSDLRRDDRPVIAYCSGDLCGESRRLAALLRKAGVKRVYQLPGGYPEWEERARCLR